MVLYAAAYPSSEEMMLLCRIERKKKGIIVVIIIPRPPAMYQYFWSKLGRKRRKTRGAAAATHCAVPGGQFELFTSSREPTNECVLRRKNMRPTDVSHKSDFSFSPSPPPLTRDRYLFILYELFVFPAVYARPVPFALICENRSFFSPSAVQI